MFTTNIEKKHASKLHDVLGTMGYSVNEAQCLDLMVDIEKQEDRKSLNPPKGENRAVAEKIMDTMVEGFMEQDYEKATQFTEDKYLVHFTKAGFKRDVQTSFEDLGVYVRRQYLGALKATVHPGEEDERPDHMRYVWRGIFEKKQALIVLALYCKNGTYYLSDFSCR